VISFIGAGPGAADLLTLRAVHRLERADFVLWAGSLVSAEVLRHCRADATLLDTKAMTLEDVTAVYAAHPDATIARLHSGDPAWYSAVGEQIDWCLQHERAFEIVPGVSAVGAAAAAAGLELTVPGVSQSVVITRLARRTAAALGPGDDLVAYAARGGVMAFFLSAGDPERLQATLLGQVGIRCGYAGADRVSGELAGRANRRHQPWTGSRRAFPTIDFDLGADPGRRRVAARRQSAAKPRIRPSVRPPLPDQGRVVSAPSAISVVGMHGGQTFGHAAQATLAEADVLVASARHLAHIDVRPDQETIELSGDLGALLDRIQVERALARRIVVLASGDPGFFGIVRLLGDRFGHAVLDIHPAPSSVSLAFARIGRAWDDALVVSAHGRPLEAAVAASLRLPKVAVLTAPTQPPQALGRMLVEAGSPPRAVTVASRLGERGECITHTDLEGLASGTFDPMSVVLLLDPSADALARAPSLTWGLPEATFEHRAGMITKAEVRAIALGKLGVPSTGVLWDVGAGSGSVAIECARLAPRLDVLAIERSTDDADRIRRNAAAHGVRVSVVQGEAPAAFAGLPAPDRVFVGGGGLDVLERALALLRPGGRLVVTHVLVDRAAAAWRLLGNTAQVSVARSASIADGFRLHAENPVFISWGPVT
jgi:precorrin-6Y C5,15-methyltransferase (decarboxylating)